MQALFWLQIKSQKKKSVGVTWGSACEGIYRLSAGFYFSLDTQGTQEEVKRATRTGDLTKHFGGMM